MPRETDELPDIEKNTDEEIRQEAAEHVRRAEQDLNDAIREAVKLDLEIDVEGVEMGEPGYEFIGAKVTIQYVTEY